MNIKQTLEHAHQILLGKSSTPRVDAEVLLCHSLGVSRAFLYTHATDTLAQSQHEAFSQLLDLRHHGTPIAYLKGRKEFWSLNLNVSSATLIPRPETELLVETTLNLLDPNEPLVILDLGTGSGAIALALAKERPRWKIHASDISEPALTIAKANAHELQLAHIIFHQSDWFCQIPALRFDAIIANPPYLALDDPHLCVGDLRFEPRHALVSEPSEGSDLQRIIRHAPQYLMPQGLLLLEHGHTQHSAVQQWLTQAQFTQTQCFHDLQQLPRVSKGVL
jgi:release factor glutamine methyltransferase